MMSKISDLWCKLPKEVKVSFYYAGVAGLNVLAQTLLDLKPIDWGVFFRLFFGNIFLVFITQAKSRIESLRK
jgi:hypothetical protein